MKATSPLRLLLWLKWTLIWRSFRKNRTQVVSTILLLLVFLPISVGAAWFVGFAAQTHPWLARPIARDALALIYLIWLVTPLLGFQVNESYDLTKLFVYPISYRQIFLGSVVGSLLDRSVLLLLPTLGILLAVFSASPLAFLLNLVLLVLFLLHTLALGQAITLTLIGFLRSRRFRDTTIVLFPLISILCYLGWQTVMRRPDHILTPQALDAPLWHAANWLPPGYAAAGLSAAQNGDWLRAFLALGGMALIGMATLMAAAAVLKNLYLGDSGPRVPQRAAPPPSRSALPAAAPGWLARLPADVAAIAGKELLYLRREPQYKAMAVQMLYTLVVITVPILLPAMSPMRRGAGLTSLGDWLLFGLSGTLLLSLLPLLFNIFGGEGAAITALFSFPARRRSILLGKNIAHGALLLALNAVGLTATAALTHGWRILPLALLWVLLAAPVLLAAGNLVSIRFPHRMLVRGTRWQRGGVATAGGGDGSGCAYAFLYLLTYGAALVALLPVAAAVMLPLLLGASALLYALTLPLALVYAVVLYVILLGQAEIWLLSREPEIATKIVPTD